jgi:hypothetical protein
MDLEVLAFAGETEIWEIVHGLQPNQEKHVSDKVIAGHTGSSGYLDSRYSLFL